MKTIYMGSLSLEAGIMDIEVSSTEIIMEDDNYWYIKAMTCTPDSILPSIAKFGYKNTLEYDKPFGGYRTGGYVSFMVDNKDEAEELLLGLKNIAKEYQNTVNESIERIDKIVL